MNDLVIGARRTMYNYRRVVTATIYAAVTTTAYGVAYGLRFDFRIPDAYWLIFWLTLPLLILTRLGCHHLFNVTTERWRFVGTRDVLQLAGATAAGSLIFFLASRFVPIAPLVPRSIILIELVLNGYLTAALWISYRTGFERLRLRMAGANGTATPVLIIGAGEAGNSLAREMSRVPTGYRPVAFADDDASLRRVKLRGLEVCGSTAELSEIAARVGAKEIVIAVPSAPVAELRRIVNACSITGLPFKVLPGISEVLAGRVQLNQVRDVRIEDLLGRAPVQLELPELADDMRGCSVLITGAAGSIGSELARQVAINGPQTIILFDQAETDLYYLELELRELHPRLTIVPVVGDIVDPGAVESLFVRFRPELVFHAAAYKHVPMMEANCREAIRNNVIGTWRIADAAGRNGVDRFVLVSTDKAVRPVNVMGATKRMAEMIVMELQAHHPATTYAAVRFGNVLGSNGSVVPIFKKQLEQGKPLTVTHPEVTRYFMTIPEAVQLILQTSLLPNIGGHIAMLEMGEPIRIADLARNLLTLSGAVDRGDDQIVYTGLRPGEKLHEELVAPEEGTEPTPIPKVRLVVSPDGVIPSLTEYMEEWEESLAHGAEADVLRTVSGMFPGLQIGSDEEHTEVVFDPFAELAYTRSSRQIRLRES